MSLKPCIVCGEPSSSTRCDEHHDDRRRQLDERRGSAQSRGYTSAWDRLSRKARKLQPFCLDCGTTANLTADHTPGAWERVAEGKPLRLQDVEVVCADCNSRRGSSRPGSDRAREAQRTGGVDPLDPASRPTGKAQGPLHTAPLPTAEGVRA